MDSPVRQQLKKNDYLRHKLFRKINRRRRAERLLAIEAPEKELRRRLRRRTFREGKDGEELPYPIRTSRDYDDNLAYQSGLTRDPKTGHMMSTTQEEYPKERTYLKTPSHPTYSLAVWGDKLGGYDVYNRNGKTYSAPTFSELMYTKPPFKYAEGKDGEELVELPEVRVDSEGNVIADDGRRGTVRLSDVVAYADPDSVAKYRKSLWDKDFEGFGDPSRNSAYHPEDVEQAFNLTGAGLLFNPFRLARTSNRFLTLPTFNNAVEVAPDVLPWFKAGRFALGTYGLANSEGLKKTYDLLKEGNYGRAALSGLGDVLNAGMAIEGGSGIYQNLVKPGMRLFNSPLTGNYTKIGDTEYRLNPNSLGSGIIPLESKPILQYNIEHYPGYQLKSLMRGNPLEKQLSKTGTINVNNIKAQAAKRSNVEKAVIDEVLGSEQFAGQKSIDYNAFRKAVQDRLITYDRVPSTKYNDYGIERLGYESRPIYEYDNAVLLYNDIITRIHDFELQHGTRPRLTRRTANDPNAIAAQRAFDESDIGRLYAELLSEYNEFFRTHPGFLTQYQEQNLNRKIVGHTGNDFELATFTFESPKIPIGDAKHYNPTTLGHSRTYTTADEPSVLHVMESQSDWGQRSIDKPYKGTSSYLNDPEQYKEFIEGHKRLLKVFKANPEEYMPGSIEEQETLIKHHEAVLNNMLKKQDAQTLYLHDNYLMRQIQENLKYAAEHGQTKMRYPTPDTAAKIEGYQKQSRFGLGNMTDVRYNDVTGEFDPANGDVLMTDYSPEHKTILKKYADFPKQFKKLYKNAEVREVTDNKGNTWYEADVPKNYLNQEWQYGILPWAIGGGASAALYKSNNYTNGKDSGIHIKPENRGKFTRLKKRTGHSTAWFKAHGTPALKKMATFAMNSKRWHHK